MPTKPVRKLRAKEERERTRKEKDRPRTLSSVKKPKPKPNGQKTLSKRIRGYDPDLIKQQEQVMVRFTCTQTPTCTPPSLNLPSGLVASCAFQTVRARFSA